MDVITTINSRLSTYRHDPNGRGKLSRILLELEQLDDVARWIFQQDGAAGAAIADITAEPSVSPTQSLNQAIELTRDDHEPVPPTRLRLAARLTGWRIDIKSETQQQEEARGVAPGAPTPVAPAPVETGAAAGPGDAGQAAASGTEEAEPTDDARPEGDVEASSEPAGDVVEVSEENAAGRPEEAPAES